jgi:hypothetical protein
MAVIDDIAQHLHNQGVASLSTSLFKGYLPEDIDSGIVVIDTGGLEPDRELVMSEPTVQVFVRNTSYSTGKSKIDAVKTALHQQKNTQLIPSGIYFYYIFAIQEPGNLGRDENGRHEFSINYQCKIRA